MGDLALRGHLSAQFLHARHDFCRCAITGEVKVAFVGLQRLTVDESAGCTGQVNLQIHSCRYDQFDFRFGRGVIPWRGLPMYSLTTRDSTHTLR